MKEKIRVEVVREQLALFICDAIEFSEWKPAAVAETRRDEIIRWTSCPATREAAGRPGGWLRSTGELASRGSDSLPEESTGSVRFGSRVKASFRRGHQQRGRHSLTLFVACLVLSPPSSPQPSADSVQTQIYSQLPTDRPSLSNKRHSSNI